MSTGKRKTSAWEEEEEEDYSDSKKRRDNDWKPQRAQTVVVKPTGGKGELLLISRKGY